MFWKKKTLKSIAITCCQAWGRATVAVTNNLSGGPSLSVFWCLPGRRASSTTPTVSSCSQNALERLLHEISVILLKKPSSIVRIAAIFSLSLALWSAGAPGLPWAGSNSIHAFYRCGAGGLNRPTYQSDIGSMWATVSKIGRKPFFPYAFTQDVFKDLTAWKQGCEQV